MILKTTSRNLTQGSIIRQILTIAFPILFGQVFQNLYNSVDSIVVGNFVGTTALAAVTSCGDISQLIVGFFTGLSIGSGVLFSRYFGARENVRLHEAIHTAVMFAILLGIFMALLGEAVTPQLLRLVDCPGDVYKEALLYLRIYIVGIFFTSIYNVASSVLRAVGDTKRPMYYLCAACCSNIILDLLFVRGLKMGVEGVAIATVISQLFSVCLVFTNMLKTDDVHKLVIRELKIKRDILFDVLKLGLPAAVQSCLISFSNLYLQRYINGFGASAMAGVGAAKKIDKFVAEVSQSIGMATSVFVSQNYGAKKYDRISKSIPSIIAASFTGVSAIGIPVFYFASFFIRIFTSEAEALHYGEMMITTIVPFYFLQALHQIFSNVIRGCGHSGAAMVTTALGLILFRQIYLAVAMFVNYNLQNVFISFPVGWACSALLSVVYYWVYIHRQIINNRGLVLE